MSLLPARANHKIWRGSTWHKRITILSGPIGSTPRDLTDYSGLLEIRDEPAGTVLLTLSTDDGHITMGGQTGTMELVISDTETAALIWDHGVYDLTIKAPGLDGETDAILFGNFSVIGI